MSTTMATSNEEEGNRWNLQEEIGKLLNASLKLISVDNNTVPAFFHHCMKDDVGDYICHSILSLWHLIRTKGIFKRPKDAAQAFVQNIPTSKSDMIQRCVIDSAGNVRFSLSTQWIAKNIHKMLIEGIDTWARKLNVKKAIIDFSSQSVAGTMDLGHVRSTIIADTVARIIEFSGVTVIRRSHKSYESLYQLFDVNVEKKVIYDVHIPSVLHLLKENNLIKPSEGGEVVVIQGKRLLVKKASTDLAALWYELSKKEGEWMIYVADVEQKDHIDMCVAAAKFAGWTSTYNCMYPLVNVGFGHVEGYDLRGFQDDINEVVDLLDEAKTRCKAALVEQGKADEWTGEELEATAQALGYGALKYENLKNHRLTNCTFNFDQMFDDKGNTVIYLQYTHARICSIIRKSGKEIEELKKAGELILKNDEERDLGLHLLRFCEVVAAVCFVFLPHILCEYLYDLSEKFNSLYPPSVCEQNVVGSAEEARFVGSAEDEDTTNLLLCEATAVVMRKCFHLLGITPIYKI